MEAGFGEWRLFDRRIDAAELGGYSYSSIGFDSGIRYSMDNLLAIQKIDSHIYAGEALHAEPRLRIVDEWHIDP